MERLAPGLVLAAAIFCLTGCGEKESEIVEERIEQTYKLAPDASISIRNTDGSIRIYGANRDDLKLEAHKRAYRQDRLEKITINVSAQSNNVSIDTIYPPKAKLSLSDRSGTVDYILIVPQTCSIARADLANGEILIEGMRGQTARANLVNGQLFAHNCFADVKVFVANGSLDVSYDWWENRRFAIDAKIVSGNTRAAIPGSASFHLVAGTQSGAVASDFSEQASRKGQRLSKVDAVIGDHSDVDITLQATTGDIRVAQASP